MHWDVVAFNELSRSEREQWKVLQRDEPRYASPFLHPAYTECLTRVRPDIRVAVLKHRSRPLAFFPFEVERNLIGRPAGYPLTCCQAIVARNDIAIEPERMLEECGLRALRYDHLLCEHSPFPAYQEVRMPSPYVALDEGFGAYVDSKRARGCKLFDEAARLERKLNREIGPVAIERTQDHAHLDQLIEWKEQQCRRAQAANIFPFHWPQDMLRAVLARGNAEFGGIMWVLCIAGQPAAINVVLRSHHASYGWFMAFDGQFRKYSPGMLLLLRVLQDCAALGIRRFDLGKGTGGFKNRIMNAASEVAEGSIDSRPMAGTVWRNWLQFREWVRKTPLRAPARRVDRMLTNFRRLIGNPH